MRCATCWPKPPAAWRGTPAQGAVDLDKLTSPAVLYRGSAGEAALLYPQNANVAPATASSPAPASRRPKSNWSSHKLLEAMHEIEVEGVAGRFAIQLQGKPSRTNPQPKALAALSVARALINRNGRSLDERPNAARFNAFIGSPIERLEDLRFLTGRGQYVDDLAAEGMLLRRCCPFRSPTAAFAGLCRRRA